MSRSEDVTVLLVDDHVPLRQMVKSLLSDHGLQVVGEAGDGMEALRQCTRLHPRVIVLDISMPGLNGLEVAREIVRTAPETKIVFLTNHISREYVEAAQQIGRTGFVSKNYAASSLVEAINAVLHGKTYVRGEIPQAG